jgi:hypothetical protein
MSSQEQFIFAVFLMYGFIFMIYTASNGSIVGLPSANIIQPIAPETSGITDFIFSFFQIVVSFFVIMFLSPFSNLAWMLPINWAILGTTIYMFIKILRGGG